MKRNKKLWSFALAGALAVSNLSAVAIPMTAYAAAPGHTQAVWDAPALAVGGTTIHVKFTFDTPWTGDDTEEVKLYVKDAGGTGTASGVANAFVTIDDATAHAYIEGDLALGTTADGNVEIAAAYDADANWDAGSVELETTTIAVYNSTLIFDDTNGTISGGDTLSIAPGESLTLKIDDTFVDALASTQSFKWSIDDEAGFTLSKKTGDTTVLTASDKVTDGESVSVTADLVTTATGAVVMTGTNVVDVVAADYKEFTSFDILNKSVSARPSVLSTGITMYSAENVDLVANVKASEELAYTEYTWKEIQDADASIALTPAGKEVNVAGTNTDTKNHSATFKLTVEGYVITETGLAGKKDGTWTGILSTDLGKGFVKKVYEQSKTVSATVKPAATYTATIRANSFDSDSNSFVVKKNESIDLSVDVTSTDASFDASSISYEWKVTSTTDDEIRVANSTAKTVTVNSTGGWKNGTETLTLTIKNGSGTDITPVNIAIGALTGNTINRANNAIPVTIKSSEGFAVSVDKKELIYDDDKNNTAIFTLKDEKGNDVAVSSTYMTITQDAGNHLDLTDVYKGKIYGKTAGEATVTISGNNNSNYAGVTGEFKIVVRSKDGVRATGIELDNTAVNIVNINGGATVKGFVLPYDKDDAKKSAEINNINWVTSDAKIATVGGAEKTASVSAGGVVIAGLKPGKATITATTVDGNFTAVCNVIVNGFVSVDLGADQSVEVGKTLTIAPTVEAYGVSKDLTWTTSDASVATVANGVVTAVKAGTATITATSVADPEKSASIKVTVTEKSADTKAEEAKKAEEQKKQEEQKKAEEAKGIPANTTKTVSGTTYKGIDGTSVQVTKTANKKSVKIGKTVTVDGKVLKVTKIGKKAVTGKKVKNVTIDASNIKKAGNININMFQGAKNLTSVKIKGVKKNSAVYKRIVKAAKKVNKNVKIK